MKTPEQRHGFFLNTVAPAHPERYSLLLYDMGIIETIGEHIAHLRVHRDSEVPEFVLKYGNPSYNQVPPTGSSHDGSVFLYVLHEMRDTEEGCDFILRLLFPAAAPQVFFDEHAQHLAVEFRGFLNAVFEMNQ